MIIFFILLFWTITFGASFFEKVTSFRSTLTWLSDYLKETPLRFFLRYTLLIIVIAEFLATSFCILGMIFYWQKKDVFFAETGISIGIVTLLCFLIGQRFAKDYEGARGMTLYFFAAIISLYIISTDSY